MFLLQRLREFFTAPPIDDGIVALYKQCVAQARKVDFYQAGVPDTVEGRFDLILLHVYLAMRRLGDRTDAKQQLFDLMFGDMDRSLREMGVGDMSIRKKMRPMISAFYGRGQAYEAALHQDDAVLSETLARNLFGATPPAQAVLPQLTLYVRGVVAALDGQTADDIAAGRIVFPMPQLA